MAVRVKKVHFKPDPDFGALLKLPLSPDWEEEFCAGTHADFVYEIVAHLGMWAARGITAPAPDLDIEESVDHLLTLVRAEPDTKVRDARLALLHSAKAHAHYHRLCKV